MVLVLFVCLFVCLLACLFVCLLVCLLTCLLGSEVLNLYCPPLSDQQLFIFDTEVNKE